jgi:TPR repeat protein
MKFLPRAKAVRAAVVALAVSAFSASAQVLSFEQAKQRADQGDAFAQAVVALHYQLGWNTEKKPELAVKYALASAKAGSPLGQFRLGALLRAGEGVPKDEERGLSFQAAAAEGLNRSKDPYSLTALGVLVFQGKAVAQNVPQAERYKEAARLYRLAAGGASGGMASGFAPAAFNYAMCANDGHGMQKNPTESQEYLERALSQKYPPAVNFVAEQEAKLAESSVHIPMLGRDTLRADVNPETKVWERPSEKGSSAQWVSLAPWDGNEAIDVDVRTQYLGYPVRLQAGAREQEKSYGGGGQSLIDSGQYAVQSDNNAIQVTPTMPMEARNLWGLTEYPVVLEFALHNQSGTQLSVDSMQLEVESYTPILKSIPGVVSLDGETVLKHNFGWATNTNTPLEMAVFGDSLIGSGQVAVTPFKTLNCGEGESRRIDIPTGFDAYYRGGDLVVRELTTEGVSNSAKSSNIRVYSISEGPYFAKTELPADIELPPDKIGYSLKYPIGAQLAPGEERNFTVSITTQQSAHVTLKATFNTTKGRQRSTKPIELTVEKLRPVAGQDVDHFPHIGGNGDAGYCTFQDEIFKSFGNLAEHNKKENSQPTLSETSLSLFSEHKGEDQIEYFLTDDLKPAQIESLERANTAANAALGSYPDLARLTPLTFTIDGLRLFGENNHSILASFSFREGCTIRLTGEKSADLFNGQFEIANAPSGGLVASRIPWALDSERSSFEVEMTYSPDGEWIAWLVKDGAKKRLYLALPKYSNLCFSLPFIAEAALNSIAATEAGSLRLNFEGGTEREVPFPSSLVAQVAYMARPGGLIEPYGTDVDALGRVRLWLPVKEIDSSKSIIPPVTAQCRLEAETKRESSSVAWLGPLEIGVKEGETWNVWSFASGIVRAATVGETQKLDEADGCYSLVDDPENRFRGLRAAKFSRGSKKFEVSQWGYNKQPFNRWLTISKDGAANAVPDYVYLLPYGNTFHHAKSEVFASKIAVAKDSNLLVVCDIAGSELWIVDLAKMSIVARALRSPTDPSICTIVTTDGYYLSGNGAADGCVFSSGLAATPLSRLEVKFNRPDIVLERLGADESLIKEAQRLRQRLVRRSDFKSFEGAALIDIPVVTVKTEVPEKTGDKLLKLDFEASNSTGPLKELRVFNNGALVKTVSLKGGGDAGSREATGKVQVDLASGENRLQLMAVSEEGFTSAFAEKRLECTAEPDSRRCFIATVGVSEYNDPRFNLKFAAKDAEDMSKALAEKALHRGYQPEVMVVRNAEVDGMLVEKLRKFLAQAGTDDEVVLFFAGHGLLDKDLEYHFARHDTDFDASENMGITFQELESLVDGIKPLKRTVLFDTCHSGEVEEEDKPQLLAMVGTGDLGAAAAADTGVQVRGVATRGMKVKELEPKLRHTDFVELESLFPDSRRAKGANILTSSSGSEFSMESDAWQNGLFTFAFLNALKDEKTDADGDKAVSFSEAAAAVQDKVKTLSGGQQRPITRGVNREAEVALASFGPPPAPIPDKEKKSGLWPF